MKAALSVLRKVPVKCDANVADLGRKVMLTWLLVKRQRGVHR